MPRIGLALLCLSWAVPAAADDACLTSYERAQRLRLETKLLDAKRELLVCARPICPQVLRNDCSTWLNEVDASTPSVVVAARAGTAEVSDVRVLVDGQELTDGLDGSALPVDPGHRTFRFELAGAKPIEQKLVVRAGERNRLLEVDFGQTSAPRKAQASPLPVYALAGLGVVALGSFTYFALSSHAKREDLSSCKGHCAADEVDSVRREQLVADVSLGIGVVALGAAAFLHFGRAPERPAARGPWRLGVGAIDHGGVARFTGTF